MIIYDYEMNYSQFNSKESVVSMFYAQQLFNLKFGGKNCALYKGMYGKQENQSKSK